MDFLKNMLGNHTSDLVASLVGKAGFSADQAKAFVPEATSSVVDAVKGADNIDFSNLGDATQTVMDKVDVPALAGKVGMDTDQAQKGLGAIVPTLLQLFKEKAGGAEGVMSMLGGLGGLGEGGVGKAIGGLGKMFGK